MTETPPPFGVQRTEIGIHSFGRSDYTIVDGKIIYADHGPIRRNGHRARAPRRDSRAHDTRSSHGADRGDWYRLRPPPRLLWILALHRCDPAGRDLSQGPCSGRGRRRPHPSARWRAGPPNRRAGRRQPRLETGSGGEGDIARRPSRHLSLRAPPNRRPRPPQHDGIGRAAPRRRPDQSPARNAGRAPRHGRAAHDPSPP